MSSAHVDRLLVRHQRERPDLARPVAHLAVLLKDRQHVLVVRGAAVDLRGRRGRDDPAPDRRRSSPRSPPSPRAPRRARSPGSARVTFWFGTSRSEYPSSISPRYCTSPFALEHEDLRRGGRAERVGGAQLLVLEDRERRACTPRPASRPSPVPRRSGRTQTNFTPFAAEAAARSASGLAYPVDMGQSNERNTTTVAFFPASPSTRPRLPVASGNDSSASGRSQPCAHWRGTQQRDEHTEKTPAAERSKLSNHRSLRRWHKSVATF